MILNEIYEDENLKNERPPLTYNKALKIFKTEAERMYNLKYNEKFISKYLNKCFELEIPFFDKELFNKNFDKYVVDYNDILIKYFNVYKNLLSDENKEKYNHLADANKFDLL
jgi:hypothetical protein